MKYEISEGMLQNVILTLKNIDVRGYDSMDRLVGLVMFFENILNQPPVETTEEGSEE